MRKLTAVLCLIMALLTASALAADAETAPALWPACAPETGLWGYMDERVAYVRRMMPGRSFEGKRKPQQNLIAAPHED